MLLGFTVVLYTLALSCLFAAASNSVPGVVDSNNEHGSILSIGDVLYYTPHFPYATYKPNQRSGVLPAPGFTAVTSIRTTSSPITKAYLEQHFTLFSEFDDVYSGHFMDSLIISYDGTGNAFFEANVESWLEALNVRHLYLSENILPPKLKGVQFTQIKGGPLSGPFFATASAKASRLDLHSVYRLYKDVYETFLFGAIPNPKGGWFPTNITLDDSGHQYIPVPSHLSALAQSLPLSGTRFALKDIYDAQGLKTGAGSLAYARVYPEANTTAPSIQRLLDLGATMVGKVRTSQFAHGSNPWDFIDIPYSWNPRADGYLTASASSSGSACAIAGYEWLDFTVGSDTRGSVRKPATLVGAYGIRPSHGSMDLTGVVPLSEEMDTAGFFARDPLLFSEIGRLWLVNPFNLVTRLIHFVTRYENSPVRVKTQLVRFPSKLLYPTDHFPVRSPEAQNLFDSFADALQKHFQMSKVPINFTEALFPYLPNGNFHEFQLICDHLSEYRTWKSVGEPLIAKHETLFRSTPSFDPRPRIMFEHGKKLTDDDFAHAVAFRHQFAKSIAEDLIKFDSKSCSDSIFMYDAGTGGHPSYRVEDFNSLSGSAPFLLTTPMADSKASDYFTYISSMGGLPEITVPIGQVGYYSRVSRQWEMLPVAVQLVAHPGCDNMLLELVKNLAAAGVVGPVKVGNEAF
jgi:Asp-tRNA(Asn)/Glu-tRNA(Gln) amidotransferase A subunit family amidase